MDAGQAIEFVRSNHRAVLATARRDGRPQLSPVLVSVDADGRILVSSRETAMKTHNAARTGWASACVMNDAFFGEWLQVEGPVEVVHLPEAMDLLVEYYRSVAGEHSDWAEYRAAMEQERRVILRITPERVGPTTAG